MPADHALNCRLSRRSLLAAAVAGTGIGRLPPVAQAAATPAALAFQVSRNGGAIGTHTISFDRAGESLRVHIAADFRIGFGFITLFRYRLRALEEWHGGRFVALDSSTDSNGKLFQVRARRVKAGIAISASRLPDQVVASETLPLTHWTQADMLAPVFNPQTGKMLKSIAQPTGPGVVRLANGTQVPAIGYSLAGELPIEDWYDAARQWVALNARAKDGSAITYRRA